MPRARAAWFRWWPAGYVAAFGVIAGIGWTMSLAIVRVSLAVVCFVAAGWFLYWRYERRRRDIAERTEAEAQLRRQMMRAVKWLN